MKKYHKNLLKHKPKLMLPFNTRVLNYTCFVLFDPTQLFDCSRKQCQSVDSEMVKNWGGYWLCTLMKQFTLSKHVQNPVHLNIEVYSEHSSFFADRLSFFCFFVFSLIFTIHSNLGINGFRCNCVLCEEMKCILLQKKNN